MLNIGKVNDSRAAQQPQEDSPLCDSCQSNQPGYGCILPRPRPEITSGFTEKVKIGCGNLYITVNYDENGICEVFTNTGRAGGCPSQSEATARLVSVGIRAGMDPKEIIQQLKGIRCPSCLRQPGVPVTSCPDAIAKALEKVHKAAKDGTLPAPMGSITTTAPAPSATQKAPVMADMTPAQAKLAKFCPECGSRLEHEGGCVTCRECGYSKCG